MERNRPKNELWTIPADKMRRDHTIPLNKQAIRIIEIMKPISGHG